MSARRLVSARLVLDPVRQVAPLRTFLRWLTPILLVFAAIEMLLASVFAARSAAVIAVTLAVYAVWLLFAGRRLEAGSLSRVTTQVALVSLLVLVVVVGMQPHTYGMLALASFLPVIFAMSFITHRALMWLIGLAWATSVALVMVAVIRTATSPYPPWLAAVLSVGAMVATAGLSALLLAQFATRLRGAAHDLNSAVAMSHDLAQSLDPKLVGDRMARHLAEAIGADECGICLWDQEADLLVTAGYHPPSRRSQIEPSYPLADYPATRRILETGEMLIVDVEDPAADPDEVGYLRAIGQRSMVTLPLIVRGRPIGTVELTNAGPARVDERRIALATTLASEAAILLDNARMYEETRVRAFHDPLTGLPNGLLLADRVDHAVARLGRRPDERLAVLYVDLDDFKAVNDRYGHPGGDEVLSQVADRLRYVTRPGDTSGRLHGDEFAVLLEDLVEANEASAVAGRLLSALAVPFRVLGGSVALTASIGIALAGGPDGLPATTSVASLLQAADTAMYEAKRAGKARWRVADGSTPAPSTVAPKRAEPAAPRPTTRSVPAPARAPAR